MNLSLVLVSYFLLKQYDFDISRGRGVVIRRLLSFISIIFEKALLVQFIYIYMLALESPYDFKLRSKFHTKPLIFQEVYLSFICFFFRTMILLLTDASAEDSAWVRY